MRTLVLVLLPLLLLEVAVVVPVIVTQKQADEGTAKTSLGALADQFMRRLNASTNQFVYNVLRTLERPRSFLGFCPRPTWSHPWCSQRIRRPPQRNCSCGYR